MAKQQFSVTGTSCSSCEVVIERAISKHPDVSAVTVSHKHRTITVESTSDSFPSLSDLNQLVAEHDYSIGKGATSGTSTTKQPINWKRIGGAIVLVFALYWFFDQLGLLRLSPSSAEPAGYVGVFIIGLLASLSSCTAVVGGLVAAVSGAIAKDQKKLTSRERFKPHLLFNLGRIGGFFALGAVIGYAGEALQLSPSLNGFFVVLVAILMIIIGINLMEIFPAPVVRMPKWLAHKVHDLAESKDPKAPLFLGAMTFFLPCGFTQSMQLFALTLGDPLQSGLIMAVFALGTAPVLLGIGGMASYTSASTLKTFTRIAGVIVLILGISNVTNGLTLLGIRTDNLFSSSAVSAETTGPVVKDGRQQIQMTMTSWGVYEPETLVVQEDIPVDWTIIGDDFLGCGDTLILPAFGVNTRLRTGKNLVQFTPTSPGNYTFSCSMGMIRGTMIVTSNSAN